MPPSRAVRTPTAETATAVRDPLIDALRVGSLIVVVVGHWLALVPYIHDGRVGGRMIYDVVPSLWFVTWLFQVIPLFFFAGGFANYTVYSRLAVAGRAREFLPTRLRRLLRPTLVFLACLVLLEAGLYVFDLGGEGALRGMQLGEMAPFAQLWFLGVYLLVVILTPLTIRLHRRFGVSLLIGLVAAVAVTDAVAALTARPHLLGANIVLVWLVPHQIGYFYAEGRLERLSPAQLWAIATGALFATLLLTALPEYGRNLLDNGTAIVGITAPTLPFVGVSVALIMAALAVRRPIGEWVRSAAASALVSRLSAVVMTVYLWHMAAYYAGLLVLTRFGVPLPAQPNLTWWLERPLFVVVPAFILAFLVAAFAPFERRHASGANIV